MIAHREMEEPAVHMVRLPRARRSWYQVVNPVEAGSVPLAVDVLTSDVKQGRWADSWPRRNNPRSRTNLETRNRGRLTQDIK